MDLSRFTQKAQEAVQAAQRLAVEQRHSQIEPEHLLLALLRQAGGVVPEVAEKIGVRPPALVAQLERTLASRPRLHTPSPEPPLAQGVEAEAVDPVGVQVPESVRLGPELQLSQSVGLPGQQVQGGKLVDVRDQEMIAIGTHVIEGRVVLVCLQDPFDLSRWPQIARGIGVFGGAFSLLGGGGGNHGQEKEGANKKEMAKSVHGGHSGTGRTKGDVRRGGRLPGCKVRLRTMGRHPRSIYLHVVSRVAGDVPDTTE